MFKQGKIGWWAAWLVLWAAACPAIWADDRSETVRTAGFLLSDAMRVRRDGRHNLALRALRQMRDPELTPYFERLLDSDSPALKIHGFLGMAECDPQRKLDLTRLAQIKDGKLQAEMVSAAMDSDLLTVDLAKQTVAWPDLDATVRLLVATQLIQAKQFNDLELLRQAAQSDNLGRQGLAGLMLLQLDQEEGLKILQQLDASTNPRRDDFRELVLQTALRFDFDRCGPWAQAVAAEPNVNSRLGLMALRAALKFRSPRADAIWKQMYQQTQDPAQRVRLAFVALNVAPQVPAELFDPMQTGDDPMIKAMAQTGIALATQKDIAANIVALVQKQHPIATNWALEYTQRNASAADARVILTAILQAFDGPPRNQAQRFDDAVVASQILVEKDAKAAGEVLRPMLTQPAASPLFQQAVLLGLIRANQAQAAASVIAGLPPFTNANVASLSLLLQAKASQPLDANQLAELAILVRGGGEIPETLRLQAAWIYLKRTNQSLAAMNQVLGK